MLWAACLLAGIAAHAQQPAAQRWFQKKKHEYQTLDAAEMIRRFVSKPMYATMAIEGIYSVSGRVNKKRKGLLSARVRERVVDRKDNYATVAIIRDYEGTDTEFLMISLAQENAHHYPVVGALTTLADGRGFLCKHVEPNGDALTFTFAFTGDADLLEGVCTKVSGKKTITYDVSYLKTFPKKNMSALE